MFERLSTGILLGAVGALVLAWCIDADVAGTFRSSIVEIFGIIAALVAAVLALLGVQRQIQLQQDQAHEERQRDLRASIAVLPLVLSDFSEICRSCFDASLDPAEILRNPSRRAELLGLADVDQTYVEILQNCIRYSDDVSTNWLTLILRQYQVCRARYGSLIEGRHLLHQNNHVSMASDWSVLRAIVEHCFEYSRGDVASVPAQINLQDIRPYIGTRNFVSPMFEDVRIELNRRRDHAGSGTAAELFR